MRQKLALASVGLLLSSGAAVAEGDTSVLGRWLTEGGKSHVQIYQCGAHLCGRIVWLREPNFPSGEAKTDRKNPEQAKRNQPIIGLTMLWNMAKASDPGEWDSGRIYNPEDGETYKASMRLRADGKLQVRGYVGISLLGKTQIWERVR
jgi:uncharacterized protein (DUF2147 family)